MEAGQGQKGAGSSRHSPYRYAGVPYRDQARAAAGEALQAAGALVSLWLGWFEECTERCWRFSMMQQVANHRGSVLQCPIGESGDGGTRLVRTVVVAYIVEGWDEWLRPGVYTVHHVPGLDVRQAVKVAAAEYLQTPQGREYAHYELGSDVFNWGDAVVAIPDDILRRHGIHRIHVELENEEVLVVDHDEALVDRMEMELLARKETE
jgi:hypothetical protein